jgi:hypothetical protein
VLPCNKSNSVVGGEASNLRDQGDGNVVPRQCSVILQEDCGGIMNCKGKSKELGETW